jgi:hypothetical protein
LPRSYSHLEFAEIIHYSTYYGVNEMLYVNTS